MNRPMQCRSRRSTIYTAAMRISLAGQSERYQAHNLMAESLVALGRWREAEGEWRECTEREPWRSLDGNWKIGPVRLGR